MAEREPMNNKSEQRTDALGLLASGSSGRWDIAIDASVHRDEWFLEIDGPQVYLTFQLQDLKVVATALRFLEERPPSEQGRGSRYRNDLDAAVTLGQFGSASVSLMWDNEDFPRCFLVVGPRARSTLRLSL